MKNIFIVTLTFLSLILYGQNNMNEQLSKLFLDLELTSNPQNMVTKSPLKFEYGINRGISFRNENGNIISNDISTYVADFNKNPLIKSEIKKGDISIQQKGIEIQSGYFSINERVWFYSEEAMMKEYYKLIALFEEFSYRVKASMILNENQEIKSEVTDILIKTDTGKCTLSIGYYFPENWEEKNEYSLTFVYTNH